MDLSPNLGRYLKELREKQGITLYRLAERIGISHTTIWRIEKGSLLPSSKVYRQIVEGLDLPDRELRQAFRIATLFLKDADPFEVIRSKIIERERDLKLLRKFTRYIPAPFQTQSYTERLKGESSHETSYSFEQIREQRQAVFNPSQRKYVYLIHESALYIPPEELAILRDFTNQKNVTIGIIPNESFIVAPDIFTIYDRYLVEVETLPKNTFYFAAEAALYIERFHHLERAAVIGEPAIELLDKIRYLSPELKRRPVQP